MLSAGDSSTSGGSSSTSEGSTTDVFPAFCGDGNVDPGEECDKGAANSDTGACKSDCTLAACGDGYKGPGEGCDDGNNSNGDGCNKDCAIANQAQWVRTLGGQSPGTDEANSVAIDTNGNIILGGRFTPGDINTMDAVVVKLTPAGQVTWQKLFAGTGTSDTAWAVAVDAAGTIYAAGQELGPNNLTQAAAHRLTVRVAALEPGHAHADADRVRGTAVTWQLGHHGMRGRHPVAGVERARLAVVGQVALRGHDGDPAGAVAHRHRAVTEALLGERGPL